jgi:hypothetical protein
MRLLVIHKAAGLIEAESLRAALFDAGIESELDGHPIAAMPGIASGWNMAPVGIVVDENDAERARAAVVEWQASLPKPLRPASGSRIQYSLSTLLIVMTVCSLVCGLAYHLGAHLLFLIAITLGEILPFALMIVGFLRKHRRHLEDDPTPDGDDHPNSAFMALPPPAIPAAAPPPLPEFPP